MFSFQELGFDGVEVNFSCSDKGLESMKEVNDGKQWGPEFGFYQQQQQDSGFLDDRHFDIVSPPPTAKLGEFTTLIPEVVPKKEKRQPFSLASLELLNNYRNRFKRSNDMPCAKVEGRKLSTRKS